MNLVFDMNLSPKFPEFFRKIGYEAVHWSKVADVRTSDIDIVRWAAERNYVILTNDLDFGEILTKYQFRRPSVIQVRRENLQPENLFDILEKVFADFQTEIELGALIIIGEEKVRCRLLPLRKQQ
jgi:predicted nuclease of predicted toxin-antitoxin system